MPRPHQPGQAVFRSILPEDIDWKLFAAFPPTVRLAVLVGEPSQPGPYVVRVKVPSGVKLMQSSLGVPEMLPGAKISGAGPAEAAVARPSRQSADRRLIA